MKIILISIFTILFAAIREIQPQTCSDVRYGTFEIKNEDGSSYLIIRSENQQMEKVTRSGLVSQFDVKWVNNCTYILFNREIIQGTDPLSGISFDTLYNEIIQIEGNTHKVSSYVKGIDFRVESTLRKIE